MIFLVGIYTYVLNNLDIYYEVFNESNNEFVVFEDIQPYRVSENADSIQLEIGPLIQKYLYNELIFNSENKLIRDIPLFISVFFGDISIVGSSMVEFTQKNPEILCQPGMTGLERIRNVRFDPDIRRAVEHYYIQNQNLKLDIEIIIKTLLD